MVKSIDTFYKGNYFRSRLEARWAVFFDASMIQYEYEPAGFKLSDGSCYLPDFYLPQFNCYVEIKPDIGDAYCYGYFSEHVLKSHEDYNKWLLFSETKPLLVLFGKPHNRPIPLLEGKKFHKEVLFYNDHDNWRFWVCGSNEESDQLDISIEIALKKRFEHQ